MRRPELVLALALLAAASFAGGDILYDFEHPFFVEEGNVKCKDHALVRHDGIYHLFYIQSIPFAGPGGLDLEQWLGHATSPDLRTWTRRDSILPAVPDSWEDGFIWAPFVLENPWGEGWRLFYTGAEDSPDVRQRTGLALSDDLYDWTRAPENPIYEPDDWTDWDEPVHGEAACRDPELFRIPGFEGFHMINSVRTSLGHGAWSLAYSEDFLNWEQQDTLFYHGSANVLESPSLYLDSSGRKHMFYTEFNYDGSYHMSSDSYLGGWDKTNAVFFDAGEGPELTDFGDRVVFSRFSKVSLPVSGSRYYIRFDEIDPNPADPPQKNPLPGFREHWHSRFGNAADHQPTWGDNPLERYQVGSNMEGSGYLSTVERYGGPAGTGYPGSLRGAAPVGLIESDPFALSRDRVSLRVAGGDLPELCFVALVRVSDGRIWFLETGRNEWGMDLRIWDTTSLVGEEVFLAVADLGSLSHGAWAWISVDTIREYPFTGEDEVTPATPLPGDLFLPQIVEDAGFDYPATEPMTFSKLRKLFR